MVSLEKSVTMNEFHKLSDNWCLWAHLPQDIDWSIQSYKKIYTLTTVEKQLR